MSLSLDLYTIKGEKDGTVELNQAVFAAKVSPQLIAQAIRIYQSNQRQGTAVARDRGDVGFTKAKMYRQKGTGRARHGAKSAPNFVGGGVAHGPSGTQNYARKLTQKMRRLALAGVLSDKVAHQQITLIKDLANLDGKTKSFQKVLTTLKIPTGKPVLLVLEKSHPLVLRAVRGLTQVKPTQAARINSFEVIACGHVLATPEALELITKNYLPKIK